MNESNLNSLLRNNYFYGKLLTVRDFQSEQEYVINKFNVLNKHLVGEGIVNGLNVVLIDDQTISVESGLAIDSLGNLIIVPTPVTEKISLIDGYSLLSGENEAFLCLKHDDKYIERVQTINNTSAESEKESYNRISESYKLVLVDNGIKLDEFYMKDGLYKSEVVFSDDFVDLYILNPKSTEHGNYLKARLLIKRKKAKASINTKLLIDVKFGDKGIKKEFNFKLDSNDKSSWLDEEMNFGIVNGVNQKAEINIDKGSSISINEISYDYSKTKLDDVKIIDKLDQDVKKSLANRKEYSGSFNTNGLIYLAKINIVKFESSVVIKELEFNPYSMRVFSNKDIIKIMESLVKINNIDVSATTKVLPMNSKPVVDSKFDEKAGSLSFEFGIPEQVNIFDNIKTGTYEFEIMENFKFGQNFVSDEINHALGTGPVYIHVGLVEEIYVAQNDYDKSIYYGASEVFLKSEFEGEINNYSFGAIVYPGKGTCRIGARINNGKKGEKFKLRWWGYKETSDIIPGDIVNIKIVPDEVTLKPLETIKFDCVIKGDSDFLFEWDIKNEGEIDEFGNYIAPALEGEYEISVKSLKDPSKIAIAKINVKKESKFAKAKSKVSK
ncbi:MAG: hypothetical protein WBA54_04995 [Acidaminobacteraceae bacterium]